MSQNRVYRACLKAGIGAMAAAMMAWAAPGAQAGAIRYAGRMIAEGTAASIGNSRRRPGCGGQSGIRRANDKQCRKCCETRAGPPRAGHDEWGQKRRRRHILWYEARSLHRGARGKVSLARDLVIIISSVVLFLPPSFTGRPKRRPVFFV